MTGSKRSALHDSLSPRAVETLSPRAKLSKSSCFAARPKGNTRPVQFQEEVILLTSSSADDIETIPIEAELTHARRSTAQKQDTIPSPRRTTRDSYLSKGARAKEVMVSDPFLESASGFKKERPGTTAAYVVKPQENVLQPTFELAKPAKKLYNTTGNRMTLGRRKRLLLKQSVEKQKEIESHRDKIVKINAVISPRNSDSIRTHQYT